MQLCNEGFSFVNRVTTFPATEAFKLSNLDPRRGLKRLGQNIEGGAKRLGKNIEGGVNSVVRVATGRDKISIRGIGRALEKAGDDVKKEWDRMPKDAKAAILVAATAATGYGAVHLIANGAVLSLGVAGSNGVVFEVMTYSVAGGIEVVPLASGGVLSAAAWANFYDDLNKDDSTEGFESISLNPPTVTISPEDAEQILQDSRAESESNIKITLSENNAIPLTIFEELASKPDIPGFPPWLEPDNPIRQAFPKIPAGGDSHQRRVVRRYSERLYKALSTDWGATISSPKRTFPVNAARGLSILSVINDFIRILIDTRNAAHTIIRGALVNTYGGCDHATISSPGYDTDLHCALEKRELEREKAAEVFDSIQKSISRTHPGFQDKWEKAKREHEKEYHEAIDEAACFLE